MSKIWVNILLISFLFAIAPQIKAEDESPSNDGNYVNYVSDYYTNPTPD